MRETFGTCDGCGRTAALAAHAMDDGAVWSLCASCSWHALMDGAALDIVMPVSPAWRADARAVVDAATI